MAISPQLPEKNAEVKSTHKLSFPVLHDRDNSYAKSLSLVYTLPETVRELYVGFGIDLPKNHGVEAWELPLATRVVVDRQGVIRNLTTDPDYTQRPEPEATLEILGALG